MFFNNNNSLDYNYFNDYNDNNLFSLENNGTSSIFLNESDYEDFSQNQTHMIDNNDFFQINEQNNGKNQKNINQENIVKSTNGFTKENNEQNKNKIINDNSDDNDNDNDYKKRKNKKSRTRSSLGRKRKKDNRAVLHSKYYPDNIVRKIKAFLMTFSLTLINSKIIHSNKKFLKIDKEVNENTNKDFNMKLMESTFHQILSKYKINKKYRSISDKMINVSLLKEIYEKNKDVEAIELLNTKYIDLLKFMRENNLEEFRNYIFNKAIKDGDEKEDAEEYVRHVVDFLFRFEKAYQEIKGRKNKKILDEKNL